MVKKSRIFSFTYSEVEQPHDNLPLNLTDSTCSVMVIVPTCSNYYNPTIVITMVIMIRSIVIMTEIPFVIIKTKTIVIQLL
jgi:hypothetical protein